MAVIAIATMKKTLVVDLGDEAALTAADLSLAHRLPMADAVMLATARRHDARLLTTNSDFGGLAGVTIFSKKE